MLLYKPSQEYFERMRSNKFVVRQASIEGDRFNLIVLDTTSNKAIKLILNNPIISNEDFNIDNAFLIDLTVEAYHRVFKTKYFITNYIELRDANGNICKIERGVS